jgi:hypothetical protein
MSTNVDRFLRTSAAHLGLYTPQEDGSAQARHGYRLAAGMRLPAKADAGCVASGRRRHARALIDDCVHC